jgi:tripeptidyl-peptidase II
MELVLTRFWSTLGDICCDVTLHFNGVVPSMRTVTMTSGEQISGIVTLTADLCTVTTSPTGKLDKWLTTVMPSSQGTVAPLGERDVFPSGTPVYQLILEYAFDQPCSCSVTPRWTALNKILYESQFNGQFYMIYNSKKVMAACGEAFPEACKLDKGKYTIRLQIRHESSSVLEKLNGLPVVLERTLDGSNTAKLSCHRNLSDAALDVNISQMAIFRGTSQSLFWKGPAKLPKFVGIGDVLLGSVTYLKKPQNGLGAGTMPGGFPVRYVVTTSAVSAPGNKGPAASAPEEELTTEKKFREAIRAAKVKYVESLAGDASAFDEVYASVAAEYSDYVPLRLSHLAHMVKVCDKASSDVEKAALLPAILACADEICALLDERAIAEELGTNADASNPIAAKVRKQAETDRDALVQALSVKCSAVADLLCLASSGTEGVDNEALFAASYARLQKWEATPSSDKNWRLYATKMVREQK